MSENKTKLPAWYWIVAILLLIWNLFGVLNFFGQFAMTEESMQAMSENDRNYMSDIPVWTTIAFGVAVFTGMLGGLALLLKNKTAKPLFILSLLGIIVHAIHGLKKASEIEGYFTGIAIFTGVLVAIGVLSIMLAKSSIKKGWIR